jgi:hypothetical protein
MANAGRCLAPSGDRARQRRSASADRLVGAVQIRQHPHRPSARRRKAASTKSGSAWPPSGARPGRSATGNAREGARPHDGVVAPVVTARLIPSRNPDETTAVKGDRELLQAGKQCGANQTRHGLNEPGLGLAAISACRYERRPDMLSASRMTSFRTPPNRRPIGDVRLLAALRRASGSTRKIHPQVKRKRTARIACLDVPGAAVAPRRCRTVFGAQRSGPWRRPSMVAAMRAGLPVDRKQCAARVRRRRRVPACHHNIATKRARTGCPSDPAEAVAEPEKLPAR